MPSSTRPTPASLFTSRWAWPAKPTALPAAASNNWGRSPFNNDLQTKEFDRLETFAKLNRAPAVKFKDLEEIVTHKINVNLMPFDVRADFVKVTSDTVLVPVTIQIKNRDVTFQNKDGIERGTVNIFGRVTTLTRPHRPDLRRHGPGRCPDGIAPPRPSKTLRFTGRRFR